MNSEPLPESFAIDLEQLAAATREDLTEKNFVSYRDHLAEFNRLLAGVQALGLASDIDQIREVPEGHRALAGYSDDEKAKLREVDTSLRRLLARVRLPAQSRSMEDPKAIIESLFTRFHVLVKQLRSRHQGRTTLDVQDEYDVQDLVHALLRLFFEDVRAEEYTPSYAGKASRVDFLLKGQSIAVEIKMTRQGMDAKEVGSQLIEDIARYREHPSCRALLCLVYDPVGFIANPAGLEADLSRDDEGYPVRVLVVPKGT